MSGFILRDEVEKGDDESIRDIVTRTGVFSPEEIDVAQELAQDRLTLGEESHYNFVLADAEDGLAGYSCFGRIPLTAERYDLYWIVVHPDAQKKGLASLLMEQTAQIITQLGGKAVYAETSSRAVYAPAHLFYRKHDFEQQACLKNFYADGDDKLIFAKVL